MLSLSQDKYIKEYIKEVLKRLSMETPKKRFLFLKQGMYLSKKMCLNTSGEIWLMSLIPYTSTIRSLMNAMLCTRLDIIMLLGSQADISQIQVYDSR